MSTNFNTKTLEVLDRLKVVENCDSYSQLSTRLKVGRSNISTWKKRGNIPYDIFVEYADRNGYSIDWVMNGRGNKHPQDNSDFIKKNPPITSDNIEGILLKPHEYGMPAVEHVHYIDVEAAIRGIIRADKNMGTFLVPKEQLEAEGLTLDDILLTPPMTGDCMFPTVVEGSMVVIAHKRKEVKDNSLYVLPISGDLALRRIQSDLQGGYIIKCDNSSYDSINMTAEEFDKVKVTGQAVFMFGKL